MCLVLVNAWYCIHTYFTIEVSLNIPLIKERKIKWWNVFLFCNFVWCHNSLLSWWRGYRVDRALKNMSGRCRFNQLWLENLKYRLAQTWSKPTIHKSAKYAEHWFSQCPHSPVTWKVSQTGSDYHIISKWYLLFICTKP